MYDENERNERHDQDVDYTEGAYSDSAYEEKNNDTAKKEETSDYGGYHDSRYRGSLDGEPEAAAGADPKENAEKQPERSYIPEDYPDIQVHITTQIPLQDDMTDQLTADIFEKTYEPVED